MTKRVLLDTNVLIDYSVPQQKGHQMAKRSIEEFIKNDIDILVSVQSLKDLFYVYQRAQARLAREGGVEVDRVFVEAQRAIAWALIDTVQGFATVVATDLSDVWVARRQRPLHADFEDDLVIAAAIRSEADLLVTSDKQLLGHAPLAALSPQEALLWAANSSDPAPVSDL